MLTRNIFLLHSVFFFSRLKCILNFFFSTFSCVWYGEKHKLTENIFYSHWKTSLIEWKTFNRPIIDSSPQKKKENIFLFEVFFFFHWWKFLFIDLFEITRNINDILCKASNRKCILEKKKKTFSLKKTVFNWRSNLLLIYLTAKEDVLYLLKRP